MYVIYTHLCTSFSNPSGACILLYVTLMQGFNILAYTIFIYFKFSMSSHYSTSVKGLKERCKKCSCRHLTYLAQFFWIAKINEGKHPSKDDEFFTGLCGKLHSRKELCISGGILKERVSKHQFFIDFPIFGKKILQNLRTCYFYNFLCSKKLLKLCYIYVHRNFYIPMLYICSELNIFLEILVS